MTESVSSEAKVLLFTLAGSSASFGEMAGSSRMSQRTPTHSAIVGLLGAALGLKRGDERLITLSGDIAMAVRIERDGGSYEDFHTVETPHGRFKRAPKSRYEELESGDTGQVITRREYRQDVAYLVAVFQLNDSPAFTPDELSSALKKPRYQLYVGRRSCPLSRPPDPSLISANSVSEALGTENIAYDARLPPGECLPHHSVERHDLPVGNRQFVVRLENLT